MTSKPYQLLCKHQHDQAQYYALMMWDWVTIGSWLYKSTYKNKHFITFGCKGTTPAYALISMAESYIPCENQEIKAICEVLSVKCVPQCMYSLLVSSSLDCLSHHKGTYTVSKLKQHPSALFKALRRQLADVHARSVKSHSNRQLHPNKTI